MSRIIVKNLTDKITDSTLRSHFSQNGSVVTDVKLVRDTKTQKFRNFAFVGFRDEADGQQALNYFNNTYIGTCKIQVDIATQPAEKSPSKPTNVDQDITRIFLRNLSYQVSIEEIRELCEPFGEIVDLRLPTDNGTPKGFALVTYAGTEGAVAAMSTLDRQVFQGRLLHVLPGKPRPEPAAPKEEQGSQYKAEQLTELKSRGAASWNALWLSTDAVATHLANTNHTSKGEVVNKEEDDLAVKMALEESKILTQVNEWMGREGINTEAFSQDRRRTERSDTTIIIKNFSHRTAFSQLQELFARYGNILRIVMAPTRTVAIVEYADTNQAQYAFDKLAYYRIKKLPLYLEWAPVNTFTSKQEADAPKEEVEEIESKSLFIKNINFETTEETLKEHFEQAGSVTSVKIIQKDGFSCGYGFVEFGNDRGVRKAMSNLNNQVVDGHALKLTPSHGKQKQTQKRARSPSPETAPSTKLVVKNLPFEATKEEIRSLFKEFGHVRSVRVPQKYSGGHRGFWFVDFVSHEEARAACEGLKHTHLYGRHLIIQPSSNN